MKTTILSTVCFAILFLAANYCSSQSVPDSTVQYRIETLSGNEFIGTILNEDSVRIQIKTLELGEISIPRSEIKQVLKIDKQQIKNGKYWFENPQSSRYYWAPNGYGLKAGEGYYQNTWVFYNQVSVGVTNSFSVGIGMIPLFLFAGTSTPVWIVPKFSIPVVKDKLNIGVGALAATVLGEEGISFGIVYGVSTFGSRDNNMSFGLGYGYAGGDWAKTPLINLSAMVRTGRNGYFVTENYFIGVGDNFLTLLSLGGRSIIRQSAGVDYGLVIPVSSNMDSFFALPWLGITVPFGKPAKAIKNAPKQGL